MGNITGEGFRPYVAEQIEQRQKQLGATPRSDSQLLQQNANSAWIKLTSAIVLKDPERFPYKDPDIARRYSLFGGTLRDGSVLGGLDSYNAFDFEQGPRPAPGIISFETKNAGVVSKRVPTDCPAESISSTLFSFFLYSPRCRSSLSVCFNNSL